MDARNWLGDRHQRTIVGALMREWLYWYDENESRYPTPAEQIERERQQADRLAAQLRALGIEPE